MPTPRVFDQETLDLFDRTIEVDIETRPGPDAPARRTTIWVVVVDGRAYIRSYVGAAARWYRDVLALPAAALIVGERHIPIRVVPAADAASIAACSRGLMIKYANDPATRAMVREDVLATTLRLEPA